MTGTTDDAYPPRLPCFTRLDEGATGKCMTLASALLMAFLARWTDPQLGSSPASGVVLLHYGFILIATIRITIDATLFAVPGLLASQTASSAAG